jgi:hypothetical protein
MKKQSIKTVENPKNQEVTINSNVNTTQPDLTPYDDCQEDLLAHYDAIYKEIPHPDDDDTFLYLSDEESIEFQEEDDLMTSLIPCYAEAENWIKDN